LEVLLSYWLFHAHEKVIIFTSVEEKTLFFQKEKKIKKKPNSLKARPTWPARGEEEMACRAQSHPQQNSS